jgi:hypothetical protein
VLGWRGGLHLPVRLDESAAHDHPTTDNSDHASHHATAPDNTTHHAAPDDDTHGPPDHTTHHATAPDDSTADPASVGVSVGAVGVRSGTVVGVWGADPGVVGE